MNTDLGTFDPIEPKTETEFQRISIGEIVHIKGEPCEVLGFPGTRDITLRLLNKVERERMGNRATRRAAAAQARRNQ